METVVKSKQASSSSLTANAPSRYDAGSGDSGSTEDEGVDAASSPKTWKSTESRWWKNSSRTWSARRSAGSPLGELSPSNKSLANNFSRSMSYERIAACCPAGEWPRTSSGLQHNRHNSLHHHRIILTADKWTQTAAGSYGHECGSSRIQIYTKAPLSSMNCDRKKQNFIERKLASNSVENDIMICNSGVSLYDSGVCWSKNKRDPFIDACHKQNIPTNQSSADGFSQEVEKLIQYIGVSEPGQMKSVEMTTPDGHRAPIAELLSMGCPNGRMLSGCPADSNTENHFVRIYEDISHDPLMRVLSDSSDTMADFTFSRSLSAGKTSGQCQRPKKIIVSPNPVTCKSLRKRQATEGSDVEAELFADIRPSLHNDCSAPVKMKTLMRFNIPSEHSAFCPPLKKYVGKKSLLTLSVSAVAEGEIQ